MKYYEYPKACPSYLKQKHYDSISLYVRKGSNPGHFLAAVLANDLMGATSRADDESFGDLKAITMFIYNDVPGMCCGTREKVNAWLAGAHREYTDEYQQDHVG
jgi:hypothetical protein